MHVVISIVGFRNVQDIARCLASLAQMSHSDFEVVICENGGPNSFEALRGALPASLTGGQAVKTLNAGSNLGYAGAVNRCLAHRPDADAWWVLNPDTEPSREALSKMVARLAEGNCDAVGSTVYFPNQTVQSFGGFWEPKLGRAISIGHGSALRRASAAEIEPKQNYLNGASMLIGRRFVQAVGGMRDEYFLYCEEVEWCLRGIQAGLRLGFAEDALVLHHQGTTMENFDDVRRRGPLSIYLSERNRILLTRDLFPERLTGVILLGLPLLAYRFIRRGAIRQFFYGVRGFLAGVLDERGPPSWPVIS